jgi:hypothetical protein
MRLTYKALLWVILLAFLAAPVFAQVDTGKEEEDADKRALMEFAANDLAFDKTVEAAARDLFVEQAENCKRENIEQSVRQLPTPYGRLMFPPTKKGVFAAPWKGLWAEHVKMRACGRVWQTNMLAVARANDNPLLLALLPGDTIADPASQRTADRIAATALRKSDAGCADDPKVLYTRIIGFKQADGSIGPANADLGWFEEWDYRFCQKRPQVQMAFVLNAAGSYDIKARLAAPAAATPAPKPQTPVPEPAAETPAAPQ